MKILITGTTSGVGLSLAAALSAAGHEVIGLNRNMLDLSDIMSVNAYPIPIVDMLINCAGTGVGGKIDFVSHFDEDIVTILNTNLISPVLLSKKALTINVSCKIVNITSTNNNRYYPGDLVYSLSKKALAEFGSMLQVEFPAVRYLEVRLGLTKTQFNQNRYAGHSDRYVDLYDQYPCLDPDQVAVRILDVLFDNNVKILEVSP
jgi:short-subunit dehydrogenase